jgi:hypothetical protein
VTLTAVWCNYERPDSPNLWMASDSRISDGEVRLIDEGIKIFEVPIVCRGAGESGFYDEPYFDTSIGLACAGGTLVFQQVYGTLVPILRDLISPIRRVPTCCDIAVLIGKVLTIYVRSLGSAGRRGADAVSIIVGGEFKVGYPEAYELSPRKGDEAMIEFVPRRLDLADGKVRFIGNRVEEAQDLYGDFALKDEPGASRHRAPLNVIRTFINDRQVKSIGGDVQIGFSAGGTFRRTASAVVGPAGPPQTVLRLNSIDLADLGRVGDCMIGLNAMVSP